jgi:hypothetical protein
LPDKKLALPEEINAAIHAGIQLMAASIAHLPGNANIGHYLGRFNKI